MTIITKLTGLEEIRKNLKVAENRVIRAFIRGMIKAGLHLQRESQKIVPVDTGVLRASAFTRREGVSSQTEVKVGYTAAYAIFVHEDLTAQHKPGKSAKFLEIPARENRREFIRIIKQEIERA